METPMLSEALREVSGPLGELLKKLGGKNGSEWLEALKRFLRKENPWPAKAKKTDPILDVPCKPWPILPLQPFDPAEFIGKGWSYWRGPLDGNGVSKTDEPDEDEREKALMEFDTSKLQGAFCVRRDEQSISGEDYLTRLKNDGRIRLGPRQFLALWNEPGKKTLERLRKEQKVDHLYFFVPLRNPNGERCVLYLDWSGRAWRWYYYWLARGWDASDRAAVLSP